MRAVESSGMHCHCFVHCTGSNTPSSSHHPFGNSQWSMEQGASCVSHLYHALVGMDVDIYSLIPRYHCCSTILREHGAKNRHGNTVISILYQHQDLLCLMRSQSALVAQGNA